MKSISMRCLGPVACALVGVIAFAGDANADVVTMPGSGCGLVIDALWSSSVPYPYLVKRYQNGGISNPDVNAHDVTCPMPRVTTFNSREFFVDGTNAIGGTTNCTIFSYSFQGDLLGSANTGNLTSASYDAVLTLPAGGQFDYFSLKCTLTGLNRSTLRGYATIE
jgi:hypothetical protein